MFFFSGCLPDADNCHDNADNRHHNTDKPYYHLKHHLLLFPYFPYVSPPLTLEVLKMYSSWQKANRLPFRQCPYSDYTIGTVLLSLIHTIYLSIYKKSFLFLTESCNLQDNPANRHDSRTFQNKKHRSHRKPDRLPESLMNHCTVHL